MAKIGYIALYRKIQDNRIWQEKRVFSKAEAWLDILMEVQHSESPAEVLLGMKMLKCYYAQSLKSIKTWSKRWRWSRSKVYRFFKMLESCSMIETKSEHVTTRLTVCNYGKYDPKRNASRTDVKRKRNGCRTDADTDNNVKNVKNEKNGNAPSSFSLNSSSNKYKTFEQIQRERAAKALEIANKQFLENSEEEEV